MSKLANAVTPVPPVMEYFDEQSTGNLQLQSSREQAIQRNRTKTYAIIKATHNQRIKTIRTEV